MKRLNLITAVFFGSLSIITLVVAIFKETIDWLPIAIVLGTLSYVSYKDYKDEKVE